MRQGTESEGCSGWTIRLLVAHVGKSEGCCPPRKQASLGAMLGKKKKKKRHPAAKSDSRTSFFAGEEFFQEIFLPGHPWHR